MLLQTITLIDSLSNAFFIATTHSSVYVHKELMTHARLYLQLEIQIPNRDQRFAILTNLVENSLSTIDSKCITSDGLMEIAQLAHGYVADDLAAVCREANLIALDRLRKEIPPVAGEQEPSPSNTDETLMVTLQDLKTGLSMVKPSVIREITLEVPKVYWSDIGGQEAIKQRLKEAIEWPLKQPEIFKKFGIRPPKGLLLYGPPGCSKTLMAKALATESGLNFLAVKGPEVN